MKLLALPLANLEPVLLALFMVFCRLGSCLMAMPGFSSPRVSLNLRIFLALGCSFAIAPMLLPQMTPVVERADFAALFLMICTEILIGTLIGLFGRAFFGALQMMMAAAAQMSSFNMPMPMIEEMNQAPPLAEAVTLTATCMLFISGAHAQVFSALLESYKLVPLGGEFVAAAAMDQYAGKLAEGTYLALRIVSPFIVYGLIINLALGITNRLMPQMPVYFIGMPFVLTGGLFMLWMTITEIISQFFAGLGAWLQLV
ncbi:flagellar biosynthetic protein FliR [Polycladidibacter hongkongensis]|uniref:flagellar biosynthetic protein FliR n=1 Tax=Polycladidibacter hongkongensis TaxID=1647556 RepID=UPI000A5955B8|nr:flagellar biosynthetic protein FliR [Pseudovibrio hongkongensis]